MPSLALKKASHDNKMPRLLHEVKVLLNLHHDGIIGAHGIYEVKVRGKKALAMVLDCMSGGDLLSRIPDGGLPEETVRGMMTPMCDALVYLHRLRIVHRDVKPSNMLCEREEDGSVKVVLADFEYAALITDEEAMRQRCGTCGFVAPEMLRGDWHRALKEETDTNLMK